MFAFTTVAMAAVPTNSVILGDKAFSVELLNNPDYIVDIQQAAADAGGVVLWMAPDGVLRNAVDLTELDESVLPDTLTFVDSEGNTEIIEVNPVEELTVESVSAINSTQAEVKFNKEVKEVKPANFRVVDKDGNLVFVSQVTLNEAKDVATLTFFDKFVDKGVYSVEITNVKDVDGNVIEPTTVQFTYEKADVAKVEFVATTIAPEKNVKDLVKVTDTLGRDVTKEVDIVFESSNPNVIAVDGTVGSDEGSAIVVAKVKVGDNKWVKSARTTIKVEEAVPTTLVGYYVYTETPAADTDAFLKLDTDKKADFVYITDRDSNAKKLALYYKDQYGNSMDAIPNNSTDDVQITNLTPNIVIVERDNRDNNALKINPVFPGEGYVKVKVGEVENTIKIVVREESKITTMELDKTDVSVVEGIDDTVKITFKDQFGTKIDATPEAKSSASTIATAEGVTNGVLITGVKEGTATVEVTYKDEANEINLRQTINVTVTEPGDLAGYKVEVPTTELDLNAGGNHAAEGAVDNVEVKLFELDTNGNKIRTVTIDGTNAKLVLVDEDGNALAADGENVLAIENNNEVRARNVGTGYVQVVVGTLVVDTLEFTVIDSESVPTTAEFDSFAIVLGEVDSGEGIDESDIESELQKIVTIKDQYGEVINVVQENVVQEVEFEYVITNMDGLEKEGSALVLTKPNASADIVVIKVACGEVDNLISEPVVVKLSVKDTIAPTIESAVINLAEGNGTKPATIDTIDGQETILFELTQGTAITNVVVTLSEPIVLPEDAYVQVNVGNVEGWPEDSVGYYGDISVDGTTVTITPMGNNNQAAVVGTTTFRIVDDEGRVIESITDKAGNETPIPEIVLIVTEANN